MGNERLPPSINSSAVSHLSERHVRALAHDGVQQERAREHPAIEAAAATCHVTYAQCRRVGRGKGVGVVLVPLLRRHDNLAAPLAAVELKAAGSRLLRKVLQVT